MQETKDLPPEPDDVATVVMDTSRVRDLVTRLVDVAGMTPQDIAEALENRVSSRTIYRWLKGESEPQQSSDIGALEELAEMKGVSA